ncbi:unnamed protein product [Ambrosiozyma monospora]|uniref:Unnamed protein product n=1 Tax=Ambrosiozyma monospora TaxID=43982 RepID=A0ACB5T5Q0_AMBMO|nr:unnamed protein product [Ambrosiozyma monospora]
MPATKKYLRDPFEKFLEKTIEQMYRKQSIQRQQQLLHKQQLQSLLGNNHNNINHSVPTTEFHGNMLHAIAGTPLFASPFVPENVLGQENLPYLGVQNDDNGHNKQQSPPTTASSHHSNEIDQITNPGISDFEELWQMINNSRAINFEDQTSLDKMNLVLNQSFQDPPR